MDRTTIMLPNDLKVKASLQAKKMGISLGQYIREALNKSLDSGDNAQRISDPLFADDMVFEGKTPEDLSAAHDDYLYGSGK